MNSTICLHSHCSQQDYAFLFPGFISRLVNCSLAVQGTSSTAGGAPAASSHISLFAQQSPKLPLVRSGIRLLSAEPSLGSRMSLSGEPELPQYSRTQRAGCCVVCTSHTLTRCSGCAQRGSSAPPGAGAWLRRRTDGDRSASPLALAAERVPVLRAPGNRARNLIWYLQNTLKLHTTS